MAEELPAPLQVRRLSSSPNFDEANIDTLKQVIADLHESEAAAIRDRDLADREVRRLRRETDALRRELQELREDDPKAKQIREVCDYWIEALHKTSRTKCPTAGARWNKVRARMNDGYTVPQLKKAIDGCAALPYVGPRGRQADEHGGAKRHDDLELICRDETTVERFIGYVEQAERQRVVEAVQRGIEAADRAAGEQGVRDARVDARRADRVRVKGDLTPPIDRVLAKAMSGELVAHEGRPDSWTAQCPAHDDEHPSLGIRRADDGRVLLFCRAGCSTEAVLAAWGLEFRDLYEASDRDVNAAGFRGARQVPHHLQLAMREILAREDRRAA